MTSSTLSNYWRRNHNIILADLCFMIAIASIFMQVFLHLEFCILCLIQRIAFVGLGCGLVIRHFAKVHRIVSTAASTVIVTTWLTGVLAASRQVWLQGLPTSAHSACLPSLDYMMRVLGTTEALRRYIFEGGSGCSNVAIKFLGLSLAHFALIGFALVGGILLTTSYQLRQARNI